MTLSNSIIISNKDTAKVVKFKKKLALRDNLKLIQKYAQNTKYKQQAL